LICSSNFPTLKATYLICFSKLWILDLVSYWKEMIFCCKVIVLGLRFYHLMKIITRWPHNIGIYKHRGLSHLIILLGLKSMGVELTALIALLR
jgi:hypothetical protein